MLVVAVFAGVALLATGAGVASAAGGWSAPITLSPPGENSIDVQVAMNARGDAVVVWHHRIDEYHSSVEVSSRTAYGPFTPPAVISSWQVMDPRVVLDARGNATVVWGESGQPGDSGDLIRAAYGRAGGSFGAPTTLWMDNGFAGTHNICLGIDSAGQATAFWTSSGGPAQLRYATKPAGGSFGPVAGLPNAGEQVDWPACAVSANGDTFASWTDGLRVQVATRPAGAASFTTQVVRPFDENRPLASISTLAADARGHAIVTWSEAADQSYSAMWGKASLRAPGGVFGAPETIARSGGGMQPLIDSSGRTEALGFAGSQLETPSGEGIGSLTRGADGSWGSYEEWSAAGWDQDPATGFDAAGNLFAAYRYYYDRESPHGRVLAKVRPAGGHFPAQETAISGDGANVWDVDLAAGAAGHAIAVWPRGEMDDFHIELSEYGATPSVAGAGAEGTDGSASGGFGGSAPGGTGGAAPSGTGGWGASGSSSAGGPSSRPHMTMGGRIRLRHPHRARCRRGAERRHRRACRHRRST
jgi:hypothetical protein